MKYNSIFAKVIVVIAIAGVSFFLGIKWKDLTTGKIPIGSVSVEQEVHQWSIPAGGDVKDASTSPKSLTISAWIKNVSDSDLKGPIELEIILDPSGIEKGYLRELVNVYKAEELIASSANDSPKSKAISSYFARGQTFLDGLDYEPLEEPLKEKFSTTVQASLNLVKGETKLINLEVTVPPIYSGFLVSIKHKEI
jgi:hypothetical protein